MADLNDLLNKELEGPLSVATDMIDDSAAEIRRLKEKIQGLETQIAHNSAHYNGKQSSLPLWPSGTFVLTDVPHIATVNYALGNGFPLLAVNTSSSPPSVPSMDQHQPCEQALGTFYSTPVTRDVLTSSNIALQLARGNPFVYSTEADIVHLVRVYLESIVSALNLNNFRFSSELEIKNIHPDIFILTLDSRPVGVVEVKKPGKDILIQPTVLGELYDQMLLVEGFYGTGPVCGILTSGEEWLVAWFPEDNNYFNDPMLSASAVTPQKVTGTASQRTSSPPGTTPSQKRGDIYAVLVQSEDEATLTDVEMVKDIELPRRLSTTEVMHSQTSYATLLRVLCTAFEKMSIVHLHHSTPSFRFLFKFHKYRLLTTWHVPSTYTEMVPCFDKFPRSNTTSLLALEDLGRGRDGKCWLTATSTLKAVCVLKFLNRDNRSGLQKECDNWHTVYPEFVNLVQVEMWSGSNALMMPHFATILESERPRYAELIKDTLRTKFASKGLVHPDVRWRNIGVYKTDEGDVAVVVYDLTDLRTYNCEVHSDWVDKAMATLYNDTRSST